MILRKNGNILVNETFIFFSNYRKIQYYRNICIFCNDSPARSDSPSYSASLPPGIYYFLYARYVDDVQSVRNYIDIKLDTSPDFHNTGSLYAWEYR